MTHFLNEGGYMANQKWTGHRSGEAYGLSPLEDWQGSAHGAHFHSSRLDATSSFVCEIESAEGESHAGGEKLALLGLVLFDVRA